MVDKMVLRRKVGWIGIVITVLWAQVALAAVPTKLQSQCLLALQAEGAKVAEVAGRDAVRCISLALKHKLTGSQISACLETETAALKKAKAKTISTAAKQCTQLPNFGPTSADEVNTAYSKLVAVQPLFGTDLASTLNANTPTSKPAACQLALTEELHALVRAEVSVYGSCTKQLLAKKLAASATDLEACVGQENAIIRNARKHAATRVLAKCAAVPSIPHYPGQCANMPLNELGGCLVAKAHCDASLAINAAEHLNTPGHQFNEGVASYYCGVRPPPASHSVARQWNEQILDAIRLDNPRPTVHARNLFHLSAAMYDAWAAYDTTAVPYFAEEYPLWGNPKRDREIAISFAAYRVLSQRYSSPNALGSVTSQARFATQMKLLGLDKDYQLTTGDTPAAVGNRIAARILAQTQSDGSNQAMNYADPTYEPVNAPLEVKKSGIDINIDPNRWQPLALDSIVSQNGIPLPGKVQTIIGAQWTRVTPFALSRQLPSGLYFDPGAQPKLGGLGDAQFKQDVLKVIQLSSWLTPDDPTVIDISPASQGNNTLGANNGTGYALNPVTRQPYQEQWVKRGDFARVLAEWWADGPTSETPPGHWNSIANAVADSPGFKRQLAGSGPVLSALEWDVKTYFALNGAAHDAATVAWGIKRHYDGSRPITMIRYMAKMGQSSDPALPSYHPKGLPLKPGLVELISAESSAPGQKHAHLVTAAAGGRVGDIAIYAWPGNPADTKTQYSGVKWVLAKDWLPYQRATFVTPAFPGYISGHSTFSRAAAEVLAAITGSEFFPGGLYRYAVPKDTYLVHEYGPSQTVTLQWATYFDASDQSGQSRLWGGIHVEADDFVGRQLGHQVGVAAFAKAMRYFQGGGS